MESSRKSEALHDENPGRLPYESPRLETLGGVAEFTAGVGPAEADDTGGPGSTSGTGQ